ncbi:hypothetical protein GE21DRAFT_2557 [Neurospora crassa]|uniref:t-SNARE coiled-coil homology domain-containing protein n=2 Tax=Neurospora crassa TaxID=5141 RepID=Q7SF67_NEUCR|nr:hypothetical protein NCU09243 [Neurospora crassa OR74A]EAA35442.2 hypothetical protein NCU09243 [Neurospora crassa OR74A]KHE80869.1 hypothetical protein GE21DRAFT_2557 [Neurospora crassa]CAE76293.1 related to protein transport protein SEC9 [Neurospora crassa]|eukprot:XP_964678.2 hypothetical protein NCU09243 [Neurospora crassa OR74A]
MGWSFGRKKNKEAAAAENPYAQQPSADPYANQHASPAQSQSTLSSTASSGPSPYQNQQAPPPYSAGGPVQQPPAAGRYTNERFGTTDKYGDNRYDTPSSSHQNPYAPSTSSNYNSGVSAQPSSNKQQYPVTYGDNKQPGQIPPDGYEPSPQELYGNKYGVPQEELTEEQKEDVEFTDVRNEIVNEQNATINTLDRTMETSYAALANMRNARQQLREQNERLLYAKGNIDHGTAQARQAKERVKELERVNRSMFLPVGHSKKTLDRMDRDRLQAELEEKEIREQNARELYKNRSQAQMANMKPKKLGLGGGADNKKKYALEDDEEMDHNENAINTKIALMEQVADELKEGALDIGAGLDLSNRYIETMTENTDRLNIEVRRNKMALERF